MKNKNWLLLLPLLAFLSAPASVSAMGTPPHLPGLSDLQGKIAAELTSLDSDLAGAAKQLSTVGLFNNSSVILRKIYDDHASVVDVATVNPEGYLMTIQPERYKAAEGQRIDEQPHFREIQKTGRPVMSGVFKTVEGFYAASIIYPVVNLKGQAIGYVSVVFKPDALMGKFIKPYLSPLSSTEAFALQTDGRVIYDHDIMQIGKLTFSDPAYQGYPDLIRLAARITAEPSGAGNYTFPAGRGGAPARKATEWTTIALHGVAWRLVVSKTL